MRLTPKLHALALSLAVVIAGAVMVPVTAAQAQEGLFTPRLTVNGQAITQYEHLQRKLFLGLLRTPGDLDEAAEVALIEDRLRKDAAKQLGLKVSAEQVVAGMGEFASRANLSTEEFVKAIGQGGVAAETFRDFVAAGLVWREVIRAKFASRVSISDAEVDRALALSSQRGLSARVLISEILIQPKSNDIVEARELAERLSKTVRGEASFAAAAREYSAAKSAADGGRLEWMSALNLAPAARAGLSGLKKGQISEPVPVPNGFAMYMLRDIKEPADLAAEGPSVEYAEFLIPGGQTAAAQAEAAKVRAQVDVCTDLYGVAKGLPEDRLTITSRPVRQLSAEVAREIDGLDEGEISTALTRGGAMVFLMLCKRQAGAASDIPSRDAMRGQLLNERLNAYSESYMADLRADAIILRP